MLASHRVSSSGRKKPQKCRLELGSQNPSKKAWSAWQVWPEFSLVWYFLHGKRQSYSDKTCKLGHFVQAILLGHKRLLNWDIPTMFPAPSPWVCPCFVKQLMLFISTTLWTARSRRSHLLRREAFLLSAVLSSSYGIFCRCLLALVLHVLVNSSTLGSRTTIHNILLGRHIPLKRIHVKHSRTCKWQELLWPLLKSHTTLIPQDIPVQEINIFNFSCVW